MTLWQTVKNSFSTMGDRNSNNMQLKNAGSLYGQGEDSILASILTTGGAPKRGTKELLQAYKELPWLRAVVDRIAWSTSSVHWRLMQHPDGAQRNSNTPLTKSQDLVEVRETPFNLLMNNPNPVMTGLAMRQVAQIHLELAGESFIIIERSANGLPVELWPIPPTWVTDTPSSSDPSFRVSYGNLMMDVDESDMLWLRHPDPVNPYGRGAGIGQTLGDELDTDEYTAKHVKSWFYNRATPELLVGVKGASETQLRQAKQAWEDAHRGSFRAFNSHWHSGELEVEQLSQTFADQQLIELRKYERDIIIHSFGIPAELLGITENSNRATIESADYLYSRWTITPRLEFWRTELQEKLVPFYGQNYILEYNNPVPEDKEFQQAMIKVAPYAFTVNEIRRVAGLGERSDGEKFVVDSNLVFQSVYGGDVGEPLPYVEEEGIDEVEEVEEMGKSLQRKSLTYDEIESVLAGLQPMTLGQLTEEDIKLIINGMGTATFAQAGIEGSFNMLSPQVVEYLQGYSSDRIVGINQTTRNEIKDALTEGVLMGEDQRQLSRRIRGKFDEIYKNRSKVIARTETLRAANFARHEGITQPGVFEGKRWLTARDARVRFTGTASGHRALHGKTVKVDQMFRIGNNFALYPSSFGVARLDINCRCTIVPVVEITKSATKETDREQEINDEWVEEANEVYFTDSELAYAKEWDTYTEEHEPKVRAAFNKGFREQEAEVLSLLERYGK